MHRAIKQGIYALAATVIVTAVSLHVAHAQSFFSISDMFGYNLKDIVIMMMANVSYIFLTITSWFVSLTGTLLNVAMYFTTHIGVFVNNTNVIYVVWKIVRDISSLILIFFILYAAIKMILNLEDANYGEMIKNIIIMGVLINFSFFFARVLIDASNIVSLQFFNAIAPNNTASLQCLPPNANGQTPDNDPCTNPSLAAKQLLTSGGLSDIFMNSLKVTTWYDTSKQLSTDASGGQTGNVVPGIKIILITFAGIIVMTVAGLSFFAVAIACIVRLAVLILLLAFSPIWVASWAMPKLKDLADQWTEQFKAQLLFLPIYMGVMYVALRILTESNLTKLTQTTPSGNLSDFINLFVGFTIVIFMLNAPLLIAAEVAGKSTKWVNEMFKAMKPKFTDPKAIGKWAGATVGRNTAGRLAYGLGNSRALGTIATYAPGAGLAISKQLSKVSGAGFGGGKKASYEKVLEQQKKDREGLYKKTGSINRSDYATEAEANEAQKRATARQTQYAQNLGRFGYLNPLRYKGGKGDARDTFLGRALISRADQETAYKLATGSEASKGYDELKKVTEELEKEKAKLSPATKILPKGAKLKDPGEVADSEARIKELEAKQKELQQRAKKYDWEKNKKRNDEEQKKAKELKEVADQVAKMNQKDDDEPKPEKKEGGGGGGGDKGGGKK